MKSLRLFDRRAGYSLASLGLLLGMVVPSLIPAFASAGTITTRSIAMSTATHDATAEYTVTFTPTATFSDIVIDWCSDTPLIGSTCAAPTGIKVNTATLGTTTNLAGTPALTTADETANHTVLAASPTTATSPVSFILSGVTNPSAVGTFYARIYTYTSGNYANTNTPSSLGTTVDTGSVALSTTNQIGVTAYVLESLSFCVSGATAGELTGNCGTLGGSPSGTSDPSMVLGVTNGDVTALQSDTLSTKPVYTQLSSNAASGVTVRMKSNALGCGGLFRNGNTANCEIGPQIGTTAPNNTIVAGDPLFGVEVGAATDATGATNPSGTISPSGNYSPSLFYMEYASGDTTGVTSTYGSSLFSSTGPVNNKNVDLTFGASISNNTPAGVYGANLSLIATGTF